MLAYLFWHTPRPTVARSDYERDLLAFSRALADLHCPGVRRITSFRTSTVPWLDDPSGYEDWATIDGSCALETLNEQAVSGQHGGLARHGGATNGCGIRRGILPSLGQHGPACRRARAMAVSTSGHRVSPSFGRHITDRGSAR